MGVCTTARYPCKPPSTHDSRGSRSLRASGYCGRQEAAGNPSASLATHAPLQPRIHRLTLECKHAENTLVNPVERLLLDETVERFDS